MPQGVIEKINKLQRQFLWGGCPEKASLVLAPWKLIELPKHLGGLSVGNLLHMNFALLCKWVWRYFSEPSALWRRVIHEKYDHPPTFNIHDFYTPTKGGLWRNIYKAVLSFLEAKSLLNTKIKTSIGNGVGTLFWHDVWACDRPLKSAFPRLFKLSTNLMASGAMTGVWNGHEWLWCFSWKRPPQNAGS